MQLNYDPEIDSPYIDLSERLSVDSREISDGIVLDFDVAGTVVDIDKASRKVQLNTLLLSNSTTTVERVAS